MHEYTMYTHQDKVEFSAYICSVQSRNFANVRIFQWQHRNSKFVGQPGMQPELVVYLIHAEAHERKRELN